MKIDPKWDFFSPQFFGTFLNSQIGKHNIKWKCNWFKNIYMYIVWKKKKKEVNYQLVTINKERGKEKKKLPLGYIFFGMVWGLFFIVNWVCNTPKIYSFVQLSLFIVDYKKFFLVDFISWASWKPRTHTLTYILIVPKI